MKHKETLPGCVRKILALYGFRSTWRTFCDKRSYGHRYKFNVHKVGQRRTRERVLRVVMFWIEDVLNRELVGDRVKWHTEIDIQYGHKHQVLTVHVKG